MAILKSTQVIGDLQTIGFTNLGSDSPKIKIKQYTGITGDTEGSTVQIAHGLDSSKIIAIFPLVIAVSNLMNEGQVTSGFSFSVWANTSDILVRLGGGSYPGSSSQILSKSFTVTLMYVE